MINFLNSYGWMTKFLGASYFFEGVFKGGMTIGLDIGAYSVKFVQLQRTRKGISVVKLGYAQIPQALSESKSSEANNDFIGKVLSELWHKHRIRTRTVKLAISNPSIYTRHISIPQVAEEELGKAVKWQAEKYVPFPIEDAIVDFQTLSAGSKKSTSQMEIVIVATPKGLIHNYLGILKSAKITPTIIDLCPFAVTKSFLANYRIDKGDMVVLVDIGAELTSVIIIKGDSLQFARNIALGGSDFTRAIAKGLNTDIEEAEKIKKGFSLYSFESKREIFSAIEPLLEELIKEINRSFAYCETEFLIEKIDKLILFGGSARFRGLDSFLAERLGLSVEIGDPLKNMSTSRTKLSASILDEMSSSLMAALGMAL